jgi:hypothetical protein
MIDKRITCVIICPRIPTQGYRADIYGGFQTREGYMHQGKLYMSDTYTI